MRIYLFTQKKEIMLTLHNISYRHPNKDLLFENINLSVARGDKTALVGDNGSGKSTLLKIIAGILTPTGGALHTEAKPFYMPQVFGQFNNYSIAEALQVGDKLKALKDILSGYASETNFKILNDEWNIEERCREVLARWGLDGFELDQKINSLSGGEKTKIFLASIQIHQPEIILLDEPSNHLDIYGRKLLYDLIQSGGGAMIIVSHDRKLLNLLNNVCELSGKSLKIYGGDYDFYCEQKQIHINALKEELKSKGKELIKAKELERISMERKNKLDARGKKKQQKAGLPTIAFNKLKNNAEKSASRIKEIHAEKINSLAGGLRQLRNKLPDENQMKFNFDNSKLYKGKILADGKDINFSYNNKRLWKKGLSFLIKNGERISIKGSNGSGKTTLIKIILGLLEPDSGVIKRAESKIVYIDQNYSLINDNLNIYEQAQAYNYSLLQEHEIKIRLSRFLFPKNDWSKLCGNLSGGEKMRLMICCLNIANKAPDIIALDEPTNNLDISNIHILTDVINDYEGALIVISHDEYFLKDINVKKHINVE